MAFGMGELLVVVGLVALLAAWKAVKDPKMRTYVGVGGLLASIIGVGAFGAFGLLQAGDGGEAPKAAGLWTVVILDTSDTDRNEASELLSADLHTITYSLGDADFDDVGDVDINVRILNVNAGLTTSIWVGEISIVSVGTILVSGIATPIANYTADLSRFAVTYTEDAGDGDVVQTGPKAYFTATTGDLEDVSLDMDTSDAVMDDAAAGNQVSLVYNVGGITITCVMQDNGAVT